MVGASAAACSRPSPSLPWLCGCTADSVVAAGAAVVVPRTNRQAASAVSSSSAGLASAARQIRQCTLALQARDVFVAKEAILQKKISQEMERAKEFTKSGNKQAAMQCLKRKKYYESQMSQVGSVQLRINTKEKMIADHMGSK
ncbi:hypothetical protein BAE44_0017409 [Dichanthelium oligosanthes]|uniref:Vacuolar protein sorting-associated protein 32-like protein 1 n=1 Tax=Dichanthelium oligosanthes TaxID=888268 RepID=A0A1E5V8T9_9POAL|nr:hypothetical protein BAE44_0017409 [Dichanthelium oligosanthes]